MKAVVLLVVKADMDFVVVDQDVCSHDLVVGKKCDPIGYYFVGGHFVGADMGVIEMFGYLCDVAEV